MKNPWSVLEGWKKKHDFSFYFFLNNAHWAKASKVKVADEITETTTYKAAVI